jgi:hypothetical protein
MCVALGLALAALLAQLLQLEHAFWVVLGTLIGFAIGAAFLAVFLAAYAAYAASVVGVVAGQAAFTILVLILFNLIAPVGWQLVVVCVEDVAVGIGVSVADAANAANAADRPNRQQVVSQQSLRRRCVRQH